MKTVSMVLLMLITAGLPAWATLGENVSTVDTDAQVVHGKHVMLARAGYSLHQITRSDGSVVNEFVSPAGIVFGVSWQGHFAPNLTQLLGTYMTDLEQGQRTQVIRRRVLSVETDNFSFTSVGHMGSFRGRAVVRSLVPATVAAEVVR